MSVSCGRGGLSPLGGSIQLKLFGYVAPSSWELDLEGGIHSSFTSKHFRFRVAWRVCGFPLCGVAARINGRKNLCAMS